MSDATDGGTGLPDWPDPDPDHVLTWRQQRILRAIADFAQRRGYAPSLREIGEAAELASTSSVSYQLSVLQRKGYLRRVPGRPRTIELRLPGQPAVRLEVEGLAGAADLPAPGADHVPVTDYGQIAAGEQNLAEQVIGDTWELPRELTGDGTLFRLRVRGDSMINAAIADGDVVVVRQQPQAENPGQQALGPCRGLTPAQHPGNQRERAARYAGARVRHPQPGQRPDRR